MSNDYVMVSRKQLAELNKSLSFGDAPTHLLDWLDAVVTHTESVPAYDHIDQFGEMASSEVKFNVPLAPTQDERKTFEVEIPDISAIYDGRSFIPYRSLEAGERLMTVAQHLRIEKQLRAALTRHSQTEQQPIEIPVGAIENGRAFAERLEMYGFECEGGNMLNCSDWQEFRQCFNHLAEWAFTLDVNAAPIAQTAQGDDQ